MMEVLSCIVAVILTFFGTHTYDQAHMVDKKELQSQSAHAKKDNINIYVGAANHYSLLKEDGGTKVWVPKS